MHKTLKAETARPPDRDMTAQQARFDRWRAEFNEDRPHEAIGLDTPASRYMCSPRQMPDVLPEPEYPGHFEVRYLSKDGNVRFKTKQIFVSQTLGHEHIGLEETADGVWDLYFFDCLLARLDERTWKLTA